MQELATFAQGDDQFSSIRPILLDNPRLSITGKIGVTSDRKIHHFGYVNTSHGKVSTSIQEHQNFATTSTIDFDTMNFSVLDQLTSVSDGEGTAVTNNDFSFPITVDVTLPVPSAQFGRTVATTKKYHSDTQVFSEGELQPFSSVTSGSATDVSRAQSSQEFTPLGSDGGFYDCQISTNSNTLTNVSRRCNRKGR